MSLKTLWGTLYLNLPKYAVHSKVAPWRDRCSRRRQPILRVYKLFAAVILNYRDASYFLSLSVPLSRADVSST